MFIAPSPQFRLKNCGVKFPVYLVEEFGDKMHLKLPVRSLEQAISNTLVSHACVWQIVPTLWCFVPSSAIRLLYCVHMYR